MTMLPLLNVTNGTPACAYCVQWWTRCTSTNTAYLLFAFLLDGTVVGLQTDHTNSPLTRNKSEANCAQGLAWRSPPGFPPACSTAGYQRKPRSGSDGASGGLRDWLHLTTIGSFEVHGPQLGGVRAAQRPVDGDAVRHGQHARCAASREVPTRGDYFVSSTPRSHPEAGFRRQIWHPACLQPPALPVLQTRPTN